MSVEMAGERATQDEAQRLLARVLERCPEAAEAIYTDQDESLTRFANNEIHQNVRARRRTLLLRAYVGRRAGVVSTSRTDDDALDALVERAVAIARLTPESPDLVELAPPAPYAAIDGFDPATAACTPDERADKVRTIIDPAAAAGYVAAGALTTASQVTAVANTRGVIGWFPSTYANVTATVMAADSSGWADGHARAIGALDPAGLGRTAIEKARLSANPRSLPAGRYDVVLEENAVAELVAFLGWTGFGALSYQEGHSFLNGRLGERITGERITIADDAFDRRSLGMPFDYEGVPKHRVPLIERGVAAGLVHDSRTARHAGVGSTGHALPPPAPEGPLPYDLVLETGDTSVEEMIAGTERGILVTRFWYNRVVDPRHTIITGMTRDGTFLIENGRIAGGIRNLRYNESVLDVLSRAERIGRTARPTVFDYSRNCVVAPALWVRGFQFTGVTEF
jgi:predicted Zn-dependent protease